MMKLKSKWQRTIVAGAILSGISFFPTAVPASASSSAVPFTDEYANGSLTLCNRAHQAVTSGSLLSVPFVWSAVSSTAAPKGYSRAYLMVYQPIQYVDPSDWSGYQLNDDALFTNPAHPVSQSTNADNPLIWAVNTYPPHWDNLMELRMYFTGPNLTPYTSPYPAAVIRITGNTWSLVSGGGSSCTAGSATSVETVDLPKSELATPPSLVVGGAAKAPDATAKSGSTPSGKSPSTASSKGVTTPKSVPTSSTTSTTNPGATGSTSRVKQSAVAAPGRSSGGGSGGTIAVIVAVVVVLGAGAGGLLFRRRRFSRPTPV